MTFKILGILFACTLAGCATQLPASTDVAPGNATLILQPRVMAGGYKTQGVVNNNTAASINHLVVKLFKIVSNSPVDLNLSRDITTPHVSGANLTDTVTFGNLAPNSTYRAKAYAYNAAGTSAANLINVDDANSWTDITLGLNDAPTVGNLQVKLIDVNFSGAGSSAGVTVTSGGWTTTGGETIN